MHDVNDYDRFVNAVARRNSEMLRSDNAVRTRKQANSSILASIAQGLALIRAAAGGNSDVDVWAAEAMAAAERRFGA